MILKYFKDCYIKKLLTQLLTFIILSLPLSCYWREFALSEKLVKDIKFKGDDCFNYRDFKKFKEELKELYEWKIDKNREKQEREGLMSNYISKWKDNGLLIYETLFINKNIYDYKTSWTDLQGFIPDEYASLKRNFKNLTKLNLENIVKYENLKLNSIFYEIYKYIFWFFSYKNKFGDLRKYYKDFDILFVKEALAKTTKILIYHFPSLYNDLAYLFEERDDYFK